MKRYKYPILFLIVIVLKTMAQETKVYTNGDKFNYENIKSIFRKPIYESRVQTYNVQEILLGMNLNDTDKSVIFDSLQTNGRLKIEKETKGFGLKLELKFPDLNNSPNNEVSIFNPFSNILYNIMKLTLIDSQIYNSVYQKIQVKKSSYINFGKRILQEGNDKHKKYKLNPNYIMMTNPLNDSIKVDSLMTGSANYKIRIITGYDSIRCNKKDIAKIIKLNGTNYQIVNVINNKVVLSILQDNKGFQTELDVVSFDSIGKSLIHNAKFRDYLYAKSDSIAHIRYFVVSRKSYDLIKNNPQMTIYEYGKTISNYSMNEQRPKYIILETDSPLKNDFLIYSPIYGFEKVLELKLNH
jgi:hypothetical protein